MSTRGSHDTLQTLATMLLMPHPTAAFKPSGLDRATFLRSAAGLAALSALPALPREALAKKSTYGIAERFASDQLKIPTVTKQPGEAKLPLWLTGEWQVEQTLTSVDTPLGAPYLQLAGQQTYEAKAELKSFQKAVGKPETYKLKYVANKGGTFCSEDRAFNSAQRYPSDFAQFQPLAESDLCKDKKVGDDGAMSCVYVQYRKNEIEPGVKQKVLTGAVNVDNPSQDEVLIDEFQSLKNIRDPVYDLLNNRYMELPQVVKDTETIFQFKKESGDTISGKSKVYLFLRGPDPAYGKSKGQAVQVRAYDLKLTRIA